MRVSLEANGIVVSKDFKESNRLNNWRVYLKDDKEIFAKAFYQFKFIHGLQQQGYKWGNQSIDQFQGFSTKELADFIVKEYQKKKTEEAINSEVNANSSRLAKLNLSSIEPEIKE